MLPLYARRRLWTLQIINRHIKIIRFDFSDPSVRIIELDVPVNAVATALKDFFSKRLPPLFEDEVMVELEDIAGIGMVAVFLRGVFLMNWWMNVWISYRNSTKADVNNNG